MKAFRSVCLLSCMVFLALFAGNALAGKKVVVVSGVSEASAKAVGNYLFVHDGIREALGQEKIVAEFQYADLDTTTDAEAKAAKGNLAVQKAREIKPDAVIVLNDECVKYVGTKIDDIPVVFAWIFGDPKSLGLPKANITGVTRRSYAADIWALAHKLTGAKTVGLMSKNNLSMAGVREYLLKSVDALEKASGVRMQEMYLWDTFADWEKNVKNWSADLIYLADTSRVEKDGKQMSSEELVRWTVDNAKVPVIGASEKDVQYGALLAIVTSEKEIGRQAGAMTLKILGGTPAADIPIQASSKGKLVINAKTAQQQKIEIPFEILSSAEKVYE